MALGNCPVNFVSIGESYAILDQNFESQFGTSGIYPLKSHNNARISQTAHQIFTKIHKQTQLNVLYMNVLVSDFRASPNCSPTSSLSLCILCSFQTARATAEEPEVVEERGFYCSDRLSELY